MARSEQAATEPGNKPEGGFSWRLEFEAAGGDMWWENDRDDGNGRIDLAEDEPVNKSEGGMRILVVGKMKIRMVVIEE